MTNVAGQRLYINRSNLHDVRVEADPDAPGARALQAGQTRLEVQRFALTANNITYAAFGQLMKYWQFFPAPDAGLGCLPVWGFARVVESTVSGVDVGRRVYGYWPAGSHCVVQPVRVSPRGFVDGAAHRQELAAVYNQYHFADSGAAAAEGQPAAMSQDTQDGLRAVLQPLFMTAFLLDDFFAGNHFFGAQQLLLSSASSKTAMATAHSVAQRRGTAGHPQVVGLTSAGNLAFVQGLGCYDRVLTYADVPLLNAQTPAAYIDFAGSAPVRSAVHHHFADALKFSSAIGGTHWADMGSSANLPGPKATLFFAPAQAALRGAPPPAGLGRDVLEQRMAKAWQAFVAHASQGAEPWVDISQQHGADAAIAGYRALLNGQAHPRQGLMLSLL